MDDSLFSDAEVSLNDLLHEFECLFFGEKALFLDELVKVAPFAVLRDEVDVVLTADGPKNLDDVVTFLQQIQRLDFGVSHR